MLAKKIYYLNFASNLTLRLRQVVVVKAAGGGNTTSTNIISRTTFLTLFLAELLLRVSSYSLEVVE